MITLKEDQLGRKELLDNLFEIFSNYGNQDGEGLTIAINGKYGMGKSTLLNFVQEKNEDEKKFNIVTYDAWKENYFDKPIIPIMHAISKISNLGDDIKNVIKRLIKALPKVILQTAANVHKVDGTAIIESDIFANHDEFNGAVTDCKKLLQKKCEKKKIILLVDELDRCLPTYQIKVLESLYHFLNIPNLIVVIALDRGQLEESIKNEFGTYTNTNGYLSKFINYEIDLPSGSVNEYAMTLMNFNCIDSYAIKQIISYMFNSFEISIRDMKKIIQQLNLICREKKDSWGNAMPHYWFYPIVVVFMLILRNTNSEIYQKYFGELREQYFQSDASIRLTDTKFNSFLSDIGSSKFNKFMSKVMDIPYGAGSILCIISAFDNICKIYPEDLIKKFNIEPGLINHINNNYEFKGWYFNSGINNIIKQLKIIK